MFPKDSRRERRSDRPRRRPERIAVEGLESRQLLTYSPFGYSLPQLSVTGYAAPAASWGGPLAIDVTVQNQGASSLVEPLNLAPGSLNNTLYSPPTNSTADAIPTTVEVFASAKPNANSGLIKIDTIDIPSVTQNSSYEVLSAIALPARPKGFTGNGGRLYLTLVVDNNQAILQSSQALNTYRVPNPVRISNPLPNLQVTAVDVPSELQPGEVATPTIRIANLGTGNPASQGPVTVELVASLDKSFGPGDSVLASYQITSLPGVSGVPTQDGSLPSTTNLTPLPNVNTTTLSPIKLPTTPGKYYIGIVIDPTHAINQTYAPTPALRNPILVAPNDSGLPPATLLVNTSGTVPIFPALPSSVIGPTTTTTMVTPQFPVTTTIPTLGPAAFATKKAQSRES